MNFINKFQKFMYGRYGPDELYSFLFKLYLIIFIINIFFKSIVLSYIELFIIIWMLYRFFSKKIYKRSAENAIFIKIKKMILKPFDIIKKQMKDRDHIYKKCYKCKKILKLPIPYNRGIKTVKCPNCHNNIKMIVLKKQKIEIIKN